MNIAHFGDQVLNRAKQQKLRTLENAVDPQNFEPNLALDLEISDIINSKKGNAYGPLRFQAGTS